MVEEGAEIIQSKQPVMYVTKGFIHGGLGANIAITVMLSMTAMMTILMIGVNPVVAMIVFMALIFGMLRYLTGNTIYTLNNDGITQEITPFFKRRKKVIRHFNWSDIRSYVRDSDANRSRETYNYLNINVSKQPWQLRLSDDKGNKETFQIFADAFEQYAANDIVSETTISAPKVSEQVHTKPHHIVKKKSFYEKPLAKVVTAFFVMLSVVLLYYGLTYGMRGFNWFRLMVIVIPGTIYMIYRVFYSKKTNN